MAEMRNKNTNISLSKPSKGFEPFEGS